MHISAYLRTHTGGSRDTEEEEEEDAHTLAGACAHTPTGWACRRACIMHVRTLRYDAFSFYLSLL